MPLDPRDERRAASRYVTKPSPTFLGWYEGEAYRTTPARLVDVSLLGIKAEVDAFPPKEGMVWLCSVGQKPSQWIEVGVVETSKVRHLLRARRLVRLQFLEPCPYDFFKGAIEGFGLEADSPALVEKGTTERDWR